MKQIGRKKIRKRGKVHDAYMTRRERKKNICACV
jgi:hypothetical protein